MTSLSPIITESLAVLYMMKNNKTKINLTNDLIDRREGKYKKAYK